MKHGATKIVETGLIDFDTESDIRTTKYHSRYSKSLQNDDFDRIKDTETNFICFGVAVSIIAKSNPPHHSTNITSHHHRY